MDSTRNKQQSEEAKLHEINLEEDKALISPMTFIQTNIKQKINLDIVKKESIKFNRPFRILIAEDTVIHRNNIKHLLVEDFGIDESNIVFAEDGQKAYQEISSTFSSMPNMSKNEAEEIDELLNKEDNDGWE